MLSASPTRPGRCAFSLTELLVVITVMAILAALSFPVMTRVRSAADSTACCSNLRQLGAATQLYVSEHEGYLPGPAWAAISMEFSPRADIQQTAYGVRYNLLTHLAPYLDRVSKGKNRTMDRLVCPAWAKYNEDLTNPCYIANDKVTRADGTSFRPWGNASLNEAPSVKVFSIESPADTWAIRDLDKAGFSNTKAGYYANLPDASVHGGHRNVLYFDWHVGTETAD